MPYIGTQVPAGSYRKLTDVSSGFNGVTTTFQLSVPPGTSSYYVTPGSIYQLLISLGGIIQNPGTDYTISGSQITFTTAPASGLSFFGVVMGDAINVGIPADGSVTTAKLNPSGVDIVATSVNGGQLAGTRNRVINGGMAVDQRNAGAAQTFTAAAALAYAVDRWYGYCTGANVTGQRVQGASVGQFRYQFSGAASVTAIGFGQRIEQLNSADLAGTTATLSVDLANSVLTTVTWTAYYATTADTFGTLASPTRTQIATGTFTVTSTVTRYNTQISVPAAATTGIEIVFTVGAQTSGTWTIGDVQLERGSVATPFERRSYGQELVLCQRYLPAFGPTANFVTAAPVATAFAATTTAASGVWRHPVSSRVPATGIVVSSGADFSFSNGAGSFSGGSLTIGASCVEATILNLTAGALSVTAQTGGYIYGFNSSAKFYLTGCEL